MERFRLDLKRGMTSIDYDEGVQLSWLERYTDNVEVPGSIPGTPTILRPAKRDYEWRSLVPNGTRAEPF